MLILEKKFYKTKNYIISSFDYFWQLTKNNYSKSFDREEGRICNLEGIESSNGFPFLIGVDGGHKCNTCLKCESACPSKCITVSQKNKNVVSENNLKSYKLNILKCIYCGECADVCPENALGLNNESKSIFNQSKDACIDLLQGI